MFSLLFIYVFSTHVAIYCNIQYPRRTEQSSIASRYLTFFFHFLYISELVGNSKATAGNRFSPLVGGNWDQTEKYHRFDIWQQLFGFGYFVTGIWYSSQYFPLNMYWVLAHLEEGKEFGTDSLICCTRYFLSYIWCLF